MKNKAIGLFINERIKVKFLAEEVAKLFLNKGVMVYLLEEQAKGVLMSATILPKEEFLATIDILVVIGGDGTFLRAANLVAKKEIPLLGLNKGRVGFLSELEDSDFPKEIDNLLLGNYELESRMMIDIALFRADKCIVRDIGLNDITINRNPFETTLFCVAYLGQEKIDTYLGDGLIIATSTGSTGYSLSVGGPLIYPGTDCFIISPIAPHSLDTRPVIIPADRQINIPFPQDVQEAYLFCDGRCLEKVLHGDRVVIKRAKETIDLVRLRPHRFFETVKAKLF